MLYLVYLDEFGHDGPFVSRSDAKYKTSPVFGFAGIILPYFATREFATWFYQLKNQVLAWELQRSGKHPAQWEKKGASLYTTRNIQSYPQVRQATNRIFNRIKRTNGEVFFSGIEKYHPPDQHDSKSFYRVALTKAIRRLDKKFSNTNDQFLLMLDQHQERAALLQAASQTMFGGDGVRSLLEPPFQLESHLYQTLQCADWICGLVGRWQCYHSNSTDYSDFEWAEKYFGSRILSAAPYGVFDKKRRSITTMSQAFQKASD
jgi:hypothetical protein